MNVRLGGIVVCNSRLWPFGAVAAAAAAAVDETTETAEDDANDREGTQGSQWVETTDPSSGNIYYYNTITAETRWEKPAVLMEEDDDDSMPALDAIGPAEETEAHDDAAAAAAGTGTGTADLVTDTKAEEETAKDQGSEPVEEETGVPLEKEMEATEEERETPVDAATPQEDSSLGVRTLPDGWSEVMDPTSGKAYYYNISTQETSWERPVADAVADEKEVEEEPAEDQSSSLDTDVPRELVEEETDIPLEKETETTAEASPPLEKTATGVENEKPQDGSAMARETESAKEENAVETSPGALLDGWSEVADPASGTVYYYHTDTQETSWERPVAPAKDQNSFPDASLPSEPMEGADNLVKEEAEEESPAAEETTVSVENETPQDGSAMATETAKEENTVEDSPGALLDGWSEVADPASGTVYYYHTDTQETSWERPVATNSAAFEGGEADPVADSMEEKADTQGTQSMEEPKSDDDPADDDIAQGWEEVQDPSTGKSYYFNKKTQATSWEKPIETSAEPSTEDDTVLSSGEPQGDWTETLDPSSGKNYYYNAKTGETSWEKPNCLVAEEDLVPAPPTSDAVGGEANSTSAEDTFAQPAVDTTTEFGEGSGDQQQQQQQQQHTSPLAKGHQRNFSAEEMFAGPPLDNQSNNEPATPELSTTAAQESVVPAAGFTIPEITNNATTAQDLFGAQGPATAEPSEPVKTNEQGDVSEPVSSEGAEDSNEMEDVGMMEIPLSPDPVMLSTATNNLPAVPDTTVQAAAAPAANDLFAAIGMPPPPFQSKR
mmetsp:Transcript_12886/g.27163  ORF Transcript_12886/g.27163 Transcript_12886/m.27163 type:complete len:783 (+) Transcript_12886:176-2524(+)